MLKFCSFRGIFFKSVLELAKLFLKTYSRAIYLMKIKATGIFSTFSPNIFIKIKLITFKNSSGSIHQCQAA